MDDLDKMVNGPVVSLSDAFEAVSTGACAAAIVIVVIERNGDRISVADRVVKSNDLDTTRRLGDAFKQAGIKL